MLPPPPGAAVDPHGLLRVVTAGACLVWLDPSPDGPITGFGARFQALIAGQAPEAFAAPREAGGQNVDYSDRYLLTPIACRPLREIVTAMPVDGAPVIEIAAAAADRAAPRPSAAHHGWEDDATRQRTLEALIPRAQVRLAQRKSELQHHRRLDVSLRDGRRLLMLFDQGMGGWRTKEVRAARIRGAARRPGAPHRGGDGGGRAADGPDRAGEVIRRGIRQDRRFLSASPHQGVVVGAPCP